MIQLDDAEDKFTRGLISGSEMLQEQQQSWQTIDDVLQSGVQIEGITTGTSSEQLRLVNQQLEALRRGDLIEIFKDGQQGLVTFDELARDELNEQGNGLYTFADEDLIDPQTGQPAKVVQVRGAEGQPQQFVVDPTDRTFIAIGERDGVPMVDVGRKYPIIPRTPDEAAGFNIAGVVEKDKAEFVRRLKTEPEFRELVSRGGAEAEARAARFREEQRGPTITPGGLISPLPGAAAPAARARFAEPRPRETVREAETRISQTFQPVFRPQPRPEPAPQPRPEPVRLDLSGLAQRIRAQAQPTPRIDLGGLRRRLEEQRRRAAESLRRRQESQRRRAEATRRRRREQLAGFGRKVTGLFGRVKSFFGFGG
jgi:hypothetical protein